MWTSSSSTRTCLAGLLGVVLVFALLGAASAKEPTAADLETARHLFNEGNTLRSKGDLGGALERYLAADELAHTTVTALEVGKTYLALGKLASAYQALRRVAAIPTDPKDSQNVKNARADAAFLAEELAPRVPSVTLRVTDAGRPTTTVEIDGTARPDVKLDTPVPLDPGLHRLVIQVSGRPERRVSIDAREGEKQVIVVAFDPPPAPAPKPLLPNPNERALAGSKFLVYGGFGVAAAGVVVGAVTGAITLARAPSLRASCPEGRCPPDVHDERASVTRMGKISNIAFITAGCGALAGAIGLMTAPKSGEAPPAPTVSISPILGLGLIGLEGSF